MAGLVRKKVKVRGKGGKVYQRSMMVASQPSLTRKHWKTALGMGFAQGMTAGVGAYGGMRAGLHLGAKRASRKYAEEHAAGGIFAKLAGHNYHARVGSAGRIGLNAGMIGGALGGVLLASRSKHVKAMQRDAKAAIRRNPHETGGAKLGLIAQVGTIAGAAAGFFGTHGAVQAYDHARSWASNRRRK